MSIQTEKSPKTLMPSNFLEFVYADSQLGSHFQQQDWRNSFILEHEDLKRANLHNGASGTPPAVGTAAVLMCVLPVML